MTFDRQGPMMIVNTNPKEIVMKKRLATGAIFVIVLLATLPCAAQETAAGDRGGCRIEGTWYGANSAFLNFIFGIEKNAGGSYSAVADGLSDPDILTYCLDYTAWRGELVKTGPDTYSFRQLALCDPNPDVFGPIPGLLLWASEGEFTMTSCDRLEADIPTNGAYFWGNGKVPFVDPFDVVFPDPITGVFERMPRP